MQRPLLDSQALYHAVIGQAQISSPNGAQNSYMPYYCELKNTGTAHVLTFSSDDGSGDTEVRTFKITSPCHVETNSSKGSAHTLKITTRNKLRICILFSSQMTMMAWRASLFNHQLYPQTGLKCLGNLYMPT